eukprot:CAMPEP_0177670934 /NCGR_PEP_ID=MMETSP0447-20121125/24385_1 /TAXON_ID=0 /ORGANISM="Stygamoeba regulata, Strain BSH-02190019" /LENGTH=224 /DNA_ID=CAMNT_0019178193 /DNA_START=58 /DNA_END=732 /DNA_ORIENTATION=+
MGQEHSAGSQPVSELPGSRRHPATVDVHGADQDGGRMPSGGIAKDPRGARFVFFQGAADTELARQALPRPMVDGRVQSLRVTEVREGVRIHLEENTGHSDLQVHAVVLCYDVNDRITLDQLTCWLNVSACKRAPVRLLVGVERPGAPPRPSLKHRKDQEYSSDEEEPSSSRVPKRCAQEFANEHGFELYLLTNDPDCVPVDQVLSRLLLDHYYPLEVRLTKAAR